MNDVQEAFEKLVVLFIVILGLLLVGAGIWGFKPVENYLQWWNKAGQKTARFLVLVPFRLIKWITTGIWRIYFPKKKPKKKRQKK